MDSIHTCIALMKHNCFMASLDLQDAFYSIPIDRKTKKFFKFEFIDKLFRFTALPMGYARSPLIFTKLMKPVFSQLRKQGHVSSSFLDDSFLEGDTYDACKQNLADTITLMAKLGLTIHPEKSVIEQTQTIEHLGFTLNSMNMTVSLTEEKFSKIREKCLNVNSHKNPTIREVANLIRSMISYLPGVQYGALHYRYLERDKIIALKENRGNFDATMTVSNNGENDIKWWMYHSNECVTRIDHGESDYELFTDASNKGWGASYDGHKTGGHWDMTETPKHINVLELLAVFYGLKSFFP